MKHERRVNRDIKAIDTEIGLINESDKPAKIKSREISDLEAKRGKLFNQLLKKEDQ